MKISSKFVGVPLKEYRRVVNWRDTKNYAAAIDDNNALIKIELGDVVKIETTRFETG